MEPTAESHQALHTTIRIHSRHLAQLSHHLEIIPFNQINT